MTQEEKAKAYDKALERAEGVIEQNPLMEYLKKGIEYIFPELKESEDERIRKGILELVRQSSEVLDKQNQDNMVSWLEKQGRIDNCPLESSTNIIMTDSKKNQVKTKFHEGQWIVQENIGVYKVIEVCESWYEVIDIEDNHYSISFDKEYMCHLWTIQDAKDGDVLAFDNEIIVIFKDLYNTTTFHSYCHVEESVFSVSKDDMPDWWEGKGFHPAIKEQHDTLFAKMKEAGYEWDTENKQLKKISQRMISAEAKEAMYSKPAWSEEDEGICNGIINDIANDKSICKFEISKRICDVQINWLKSLKDKCAWKPSEEQLDALKRIQTGVIQFSVLQSLYNDLKKL